MNDIKNYIFLLKNLMNQDQRSTSVGKSKTLSGKSNLAGKKFEDKMMDVFEKSMPIIAYDDDFIDKKRQYSAWRFKIQIAKNKQINDKRSILKEIILENEGYFIIKRDTEIKYRKEVNNFYFKCGETIFVLDSAIYSTFSFLEHIFTLNNDVTKLLIFKDSN